MALTRPSFTQLTTTITSFTDPITVLNQGASSPDVDVGFLFNRANGLVSNVALYWSESAQSFVTAYTSNTGITNTNVSATSYANVRTGNITANGFFWSNGAVFSSSSYGNTDVAAYLPTNATITGIQANLGAYQGWANTQITAIDANLGTATTNITTLFSNAAGQANQITGANAAIVTANSAVVSFIGTINNNLSTAITANTNAANAAIVTANTSLKSYVDTQDSAITTAWTVNAATQQTQINSLATNANANVAAYLPTYSGAVGGTIVSTNFSTGNAVITGGSINATTVGATTKSSGGFTTLTATGATTLTSGTESLSTATGALVVTGGVGVSGNLWIGGNLYVANVVATTTNQLVVNDPLVYFQNPAPAPYNFDIGFYSNFVGGPVNAYGHSGLVRQQSANAWVFFSNVKSEPTATSINWADAGIIYDALKTGDHIIANTTVSTSTTTGALQVSGGAGIAGALYITNTGDVSANIGSLLANAGAQGSSINTTQANIGVLYLGNVSTQANLGAYQTYANTTNNTTQANIGTLFLGNTSTQANLGAFETYANTKIGTNTNGNLVIVATTISTSTTTGALVVAGGVGIAGQITVGNIMTTSGVYWSNGAAYSSGSAAFTGGYVVNQSTFGANLVANSATNSTSNVTGAVVVAGAGGLGVGGNVYVGNRVGYVWGANSVSSVYTYFNSVTNSIDTVFGL